MTELAQLIDERLRDAGIGENDPGLAKLREWNAQVMRGAADLPAPEPVGEPPSDTREGREQMGMTSCGREGCGADIEWALSRDSDSKMPVDYWSAGDKRGTVALLRDPESGRLFYRMLTNAHPDLRRGEKRGVAHWVTCKNPPPKRKGKPRCPQCNHAHGDKVCKTLGKVECRPIPTGEGDAALVRGQWECGCTHGVPEPEAGEPNG